MSGLRRFGFGLLGCVLLACGGDDSATPATNAGGASPGGSSGAAGAHSGSAGVSGATSQGGSAGKAAGAGTAGSSAGGGANGGSAQGGSAAGGSAQGGGAQGGSSNGGSAQGGSANGGTSAAGGATSAGGSGATAGASGGAGESGASGGVGESGAGGGAGEGGSAGASGGAGGSTAGGSAGQGGGASGSAGSGGSSQAPVVLLPKTSLEASEIGLLVNDNDPQSVAVAAHYQKARGIPDEHVYHVAFGSSGKAQLGGGLTAADFEAKIRQPLAAKVDASIQAYAVSFSGPNKVDCMSLTSALAFGFDKKYCAPEGSQCGTVAGKPTAPSPYFDAATFAPFTDDGLRPSMMLAGTSIDNVTALIDRGVAADATFPDGDGYFIRTTDGARSNPRYADFMFTVTKWSSPAGPLAMTYIDNSDGKGSNVITGKANVLFYETGLTTVPDIATNTYRPGAAADHLTSSGGGFGTGGQMSVLRWLEAGATASYGTVVEPCAYMQKFPQASVLVRHYFRGETLLEAYWKSVHWPGEGVFVGEPLARPWGTKTSWKNGTLTIVTTTLVFGMTYAIESAPDKSGPWTEVQGNISVASETIKTLTVKNATAAYYRLVAK